MSYIDLTLLISATNYNLPLKTASGQKVFIIKRDTSENPVMRGVLIEEEPSNACIWKDGNHSYVSVEESFKIYEWYNNGTSATGNRQLDIVSLWNENDQQKIINAINSL